MTNTDLIERLKGHIKRCGSRDCEICPDMKLSIAALTEANAKLVKARSSLLAIESLPRHSREDAAENVVMMQERARATLAELEDGR